MLLAQQSVTAKAQAEVELQKLQAEAAATAKRLWSIAIPISDPSDHPYLVRKRVQPHGVRRLGNALCIRMHDAEGEFVNLQFIKPDGQKRFMAGGKVSGGYFPIADSTEPNIGRIAVAEGFAIAATISEGTGLPTAVAFTANNLLAVAKTLRKKYRKAEIIVCADDDRDSDGNPGIASARETTAAVHGRLAVPAFPEDASPGRAPRCAQTGATIENEFR